MTTLQVLCRYGDDPSVGNFWVTMDELANALSALQTTVPDGADDAQDDAPPPKYSTYKWRVEAIGGHHDNWTHAALYACDAIPVSSDIHRRVLDALDAMTARAEAAEAAALVKGNEWAQAIQHATVFRERAEAAEAKLAAIPLTSLLYCWYAEDGEREDEAWEDHAGAVGAWLDKFSNEAQPAPVLTEDDMYISPYALPPSPDEQEAQP